jgi:hypothetical protein
MGRYDDHLPLTEEALKDALVTLRDNRSKSLAGEGPCVCAREEHHAGPCLGPYCNCH